MSFRLAISRFSDIFLKTLKIVFLPNHCLTCDKIVNQNEVCCEYCLDLFEFINSKSCKKCDLPLDCEDKFCPKCVRSNFFFSRNLSSVIYNDIVRSIINDIKNNHKTSGIYFFANLIFENFLRKIKNKQDFHILTCVPVSEQTLFERGFNHSALLAKSFFKKYIKYNKNNNIKHDIEYIPDLLIKKKSSKSQKTLTSSERQKNRLNIEINNKYKFHIKNKNIILIDDIATTCNTINIISKQLKLSNCNEILCLTIARVII